MTAGTIQPSPVTSAERIWRRLRGAGDLWVLAILLGEIAIFGLLSPPGTFLSLANARNIAVDTSQVLVLAAGMTFILIAAQIDLSIGAVLVFSSIVGAMVMIEVDAWLDMALVAVIVGAGASLVSGIAWGLINGALVVRLKVPSFIVTLGTMGMALGFAQILTGGLNVSNPPRLLQTDYGAGSFLGLIPWPVVTAATCVGVLWLILSRTRFGLRTFAIGSNSEASRRAGVNVDRHIVLLFVLMGLLCGIAAIMDVARFNSAIIGGHVQTNLTVISAVVIGGTSLFGGRGSMVGTVVGAFIPVVLRNGLVLLDVQPFWQNVAIGALLILAVFLDQARRRRLRME